MRPSEQGPPKIDQKTYLEALCRAVPYHLVERVLADPTEEALTAQRGEATVLSIDLVGFTAITESMSRAGAASLSRLASLLNSLFTRLHYEAFFPVRGLVVEFVGDAMTVIFRGDDSAQRAATAAVRAHRVVAEEAQHSTDVLLQALKARIGLATGFISLSVIGDLARRTSVASGTAVHGAISMQAKAQPGQTIIDERTLKALRTAQTSAVDDTAWVLEQISEESPSQPFERLGARLDTNRAEKIALLEPFVPAPLARRLRTAPTGWRIETEVRQAVVVFAEIQGFNGRALDRLNALLLMSRSLLRAFQKYDGLVLKVTATATGHQAMVLFGAHRPTDNDDEKAVLASLEAMTRLSSFRITDELLSMRVGIHRGDVLFGAVGSDSKHDLTAIGDTVNLAARVAAKAKPLEVLVTEQVHNAVAGVMTLSSLVPVDVKGKKAPIMVSTVHGAAPGNAHYARKRQLERFSAGREAVQAKFHALADAGLAGQGSLIGLLGPAGTGKSHLLSGLVDHWVGNGGVAVIGRCQYSVQATPLAPVRQFFEAFLGISSGDSDTSRAVKLRERLNEYGIGSEATELISFLQPVRQPNGTDETLSDFSDPRARDRLLSAVLKFADQRFDRSKVLYVLEDLHFADTLTLECVRGLSKLRKNRPMLLVCTSRLEPSLAEVRSSLDHELRLDNLDQRAAAALVCHELRASSVDDELNTFLWRRTQGNPEYLVQSLRFLADRFLIRVQDGVVMTGTIGAVGLDEVVPPTWAQVALARLDGLSEIERRVLRTASAIGFRFTEPVLEETETSLSPDTIRTAVEALENQQLFVNDPVQPHAYSFRDELTRSMAYSVIPETERKLMHGRIAAALERLSKPVLNASATIAHHYERADRLGEAAKWLESAVLQTARAGLSREQGFFVEKLNALKKRLA